MTNSHRNELELKSYSNLGLEKNSDSNDKQQCVTPCTRPKQKIGVFLVTLPYLEKPTLPKHFFALK